jgi:hypothetical protein
LVTTVNEKNAKEIENKSQGTRLAHGAPPGPERRAFADGGAHWAPLI